MTTCMLLSGTNPQSNQFTLLKQESQALNNDTLYVATLQDACEQTK